VDKVEEGYALPVTFTGSFLLVAPRMTRLFLGSPRKVLMVQLHPSNFPSFLPYIQEACTWHVSFWPHLGGRAGQLVPSYQEGTDRFRLFGE
jgi:hypothetical protein